MTGDRWEDDFLTGLKARLPSPPRWLLTSVGVLSAIQIIIAVPWLVDRDPWNLLGPAGTGHLARDGALGLVIGIAGALTVWRPRWALPCFVMAAAALVAQTAAGFMAAEPFGSPFAVSELIHLPAVVLTCLIGLLASPLPPLSGRSLR